MAMLDLQSKIQKAVTTVRWCIDPFTDCLQEVTSGDFHLKNSLGKYYFLMHKNSNSLTRGLNKANGCFFVGICSYDPSLNCTVFIRKCEIINLDNGEKYLFEEVKYGVLESNHQILSFVTTKHSFEFLKEMIAAYISTPDILCLEITVEYLFVVNIVKSMNKIQEDFTDNKYKILKNYQEMFLKNELCDVIFFIEEEQIKAHTFVLGAHSPVYLALFNNKDKVKNFYEIDYRKDGDINCKLFSAFLDVLYGIKEVKEFEELSMDLMIIMDKFDVNTFKNECEKNVIHQINNDNVVKVLFIAKDYNFHLLKKAALKHLKKNFELIKKSPEFDKIIHDKILMKEILH